MSRAEPKRKNVAGMVSSFPLIPTLPTPVVASSIPVFEARGFLNFNPELSPPSAFESLVALEPPVASPGVPTPETVPEVLVFDRMDAPSLQNWTDTHTYDGILKDRISLYPSLRQKRHPSVVKIMRKCFANISSSPWLKKTLVENQQNYDPTNEVDATDILCSIYDIYSTDSSKKEIIESLLKEQFDDMATGFCSQGRCTRLLQVFFTAKEN